MGREAKMPVHLTPCIRPWTLSLESCTLSLESCTLANFNHMGREAKMPVNPTPYVLNPEP
jgi:hypothetical protein